MRADAKCTRRAVLLSVIVPLAACASRKIKTSSVHYETGPATTGKVLVAYGTRAGSTAEVADFIGKKLSSAGWSVDVDDVEVATDLSGYRAVVIGSAIRAGNVLPETREFVRTHRIELRKIPVAYFAVCMTLRQDSPENRAKASGYLDPLRSEVEPLDVGLFAGKVDYAKLDARSRLMAKAVSLPSGDFRDWPAIEAWATALPSRLKLS